jgi:hypothetical protein
MKFYIVVNIVLDIQSGAGEWILWWRCGARIQWFWTCLLHSWHHLLICLLAIWSQQRNENQLNSVLFSRGALKPRLKRNHLMNDKMQTTIWSILCATVTVRWRYSLWGVPIGNRRKFLLEVSLKAALQLPSLCFDGACAEFLFSHVYQDRHDMVLHEENQPM